MKKATILILAAMLVLGGCGGSDRVDPPVISPELQAGIETWLDENGQPPAEYVLGLFEERDVVILGEFHRIRHDVEFVQSLLPRLREAGVNVFATEFARRADQPLIDSLLAAPDWDESLAREIVFRMFMPWGYREYVDIFKAAWRVNREGGELRVVGVNNTLDYSQFESEADSGDADLWKRVLGNQTEADWAEAVLAQVGRGEKVLVHSGINHAITGFQQPRVENEQFAGFGRPRMGNVLREALGERVVTVFLHAPWNSAAGYDGTYVHPADGRLDAFMLAREGGPFPVGFDVAGSPLAGLAIENAVYMHGYNPFTLAAFCDGWIYTRPLSEYEPVTYIEGWIHEENVGQARAVAMNPRWREYDVEKFDTGLKSYRDDHERFFGRLR